MNGVSLILYHKDTTGQNFLASLILGAYLRKEQNQAYQIMQIDYLAELNNIVLNTESLTYPNVYLIGQSLNTQADLMPFANTLNTDEPRFILINSYQAPVKTQTIMIGNLPMQVLGKGKTAQPISNLEMLLKSISVDKVYFHDQLSQQIIPSIYTRDLALLEYAHGYSLSKGSLSWLRVMLNPTNVNFYFRGTKQNLNIAYDSNEHKLPKVAYNLYTVSNKEFALVNHYGNYLITHLAKVKVNGIFDIDMNSKNNSILRYQISDHNEETKQIFKDWIAKFTFKVKEPMHNTGYAVSPLNWHLIMESYLQR